MAGTFCLPRDVCEPCDCAAPPDVQILVEEARRISRLSQVSVDGFLPNQRHDIAMGLATIHIAQMMEASLRHFTVEPYL